jgi:hypothetical protein
MFLFNQDDAGGILTIDPWYVSNTPLAPMDMKYGPDGALRFTCEVSIDGRPLPSRSMCMIFPAMLRSS